MLLGLSGKMGTGKSTLAKHIYDNNSNVQTFKCAGALYAMQDMIYEFLDLKMVGEKDRDLLVALGMWGRAKNPNIWLDKALREALHHVQQGGVAIIDDIRFTNEAEAIIKNGGLLVRIEGLQRGPNLNPELMTSQTEVALDGFDFTNRIQNLHGVSRTIEQLEELIIKHRR